MLSAWIWNASSRSLIIVCNWFSLKDSHLSILRRIDGDYFRVWLLTGFWICWWMVFFVLGHHHHHGTHSLCVGSKRWLWPNRACCGDTGDSLLLKCQIDDGVHVCCSCAARVLRRGFGPIAADCIQLETRMVEGIELDIQPFVETLQLPPETHSPFLIRQINGSFHYQTHTTRGESSIGSTRQAVCSHQKRLHWTLRRAVWFIRLMNWTTKWIELICRLAES